MTIKIITILLLAFFQNVSFTIVSRSRNRSSFKYHMIASVFSNSVWFLTFRQLVLMEINWILFVPYTLGTVAGSLSGAKVSMWIETRVSINIPNWIEKHERRLLAMGITELPLLAKTRTPYQEARESYSFRCEMSKVPS